MCFQELWRIFGKLKGENLNHKLIKIQLTITNKSILTPYLKRVTKYLQVFLRLQIDIQVKKFQ